MPKARVPSTIKNPLTKTQLLTTIAEQTSLSRTEVAAVMDSLSATIARHLKKRGEVRINTARDIGGQIQGPLDPIVARLGDALSRTLPAARARADREHAAEAAHLSFVSEAMHVGDRADQFVRFATEPGRMGATWSAQAVAVLTGWRAARLREL